MDRRGVWPRGRRRVTPYRAELERILLDRGWRLVVFPAGTLRTRYAVIPDWERHGWRCVAHVFWFTRLHRIEHALGLTRIRRKAA